MGEKIKHIVLGLERFLNMHDKPCVKGESCGLLLSGKPNIKRGDIIVGNKAQKYAQIYLGYYKQGDDLNFHIKNTKTLEDALEFHAQQMDDSAKVLRTVAQEIKKYDDIDIEADTHYVGIGGPDELIDRLVELQLAEEELEEAKID